MTLTKELLHYFMSYTYNGSPIKLEIGSGGNPHPGYVHLDASSNAKDVDIIADASSIPLPDESVEELLAINVLEHFEWHRVPSVLKEWSRILIKSGRIVIHIPDMMWLVDFLSNDRFDWKTDAGHQPFDAGTDKWQYFNHYVMSTDAPFNMHRSVYTFNFLQQLLSKVGISRMNRLHTEKRWLYIEAFKD